MKIPLFLKSKIFLLLVIIGTAFSLALIPRFAFAQTTFPIVFDFDKGTPTLAESQSTPFSQASNGIIANFSSVPDSAGFSIQSYSTTFLKLSQFSGNYLYDSKPSRDSLEIYFNAPITSLSLKFSTIEFHGGPGVEPSNITLTAYLDSTVNSPVGSAIARGTWPSGDAYPQGVLTFTSSNQNFNLVKVEVPYQGPNGAVDFFVDDVTVTAAANAIPEFPSVNILLTILLIATLSTAIAIRQLSKQSHEKSHIFIN